MADKKYTTHAGVVQFPPNERHIAKLNTTIKEVTFKRTGSLKVSEHQWANDQQLIKASVWPNSPFFKLVEFIQPGDFVAFDGVLASYQANKQDGTPYTGFTLSTTQTMDAPSALVRMLMAGGAQPASIGDAEAEALQEGVPWDSQGEDWS